MDHDTITIDAQHFVGSKDLTDVRGGSCHLTNCANLRCLETRAGKTECVKDKWNHPELKTTLSDASTVGDLARVKYILHVSDGQPNINSIGKDNMTPVMRAAKGGHRDVFELLVREGANLSLVDRGDRNILHLACIGGIVEIVKYVLKQNIVGINSKDKDRHTPAMVAVLYKRKDVLDLLVEARADLSQVSTNKETILHMACEGGNVEIVKCLLKHGTVDIDSRDVDGWTPVMRAAKAEHKDVFDILVGAGADLSQVFYDKETILHVACEGGNVEIVKYLLKQGTVDIDSRDLGGWTPVMYVARDGQKDVFDVLVEAGADLSLMTNNAETILHVACEGDSVEIIKYLLKHDIVNIDSRDINGWTPVMHAVSDGHKDVFDVFVEAGADLSQVGNDNDNILHVAGEGRSVEIIKYLLKHDIANINSLDVECWTAVMRAVFAGHKEIFDVLVEAGASLSQVNNVRENILHLACDGNNVEIVKYLLKHDIADINSRDDQGQTPVMHATLKENEDVFDLLMKWGADMSLLDDDRNNILHLACGRDSVEVVKRILKHNIVDINSRGGNDRTPIMIAASEGDEAVFFLLVENKADLTIMNDAGDDILVLACEGGNEDIVNYVRNIEERYREDDSC